MNRAAGLAIGIVVVTAAVAAGGAWYTGTQLEPVLQNAISQANKELAVSFTGADGRPAATLELLSVERHVFSSVAHYRVKLLGAELGGEQGSRELLLVDNIEHGPLPWSRLKSLRFMPVMAASNFALERSPDSEPWFAMSQNVSPLQGHASIGYDRASEGQLHLLPLQWQDETGTVRFSGLTANASLSPDAHTYTFTGSSDELSASFTGPKGTASLQIKGLSFDTGGTKGESGLYLGHSDLKVVQVQLSLPDVGLVQLDNATSTGLMQEVEGQLAAQLAYDIGMVSYAGKPIAATQMAWKFSHIDIVASQRLLELYRTVIAPQLQGETPDGLPPKVVLAPGEQQQFDAGLRQLLEGRPRVELERFTLKTPHGESRLNMTAELANPEPLKPGSPQYAQKLLGQFDARLQLSKAMLADLGSLQASAQGQVDPDRAGQDMSETVGGLGQMLGLLTQEGDNLLSTLRYSDGMVDFNGRKMTSQEFMSTVVGQLGALRQQ